MALKLLAHLRGSHSAHGTILVTLRSDGLKGNLWQRNEAATSVSGQTGKNATALKKKKLLQGTIKECPFLKRFTARISLVPHSVLRLRRELGVCSRGPTITPSFLTVTSIHGQITPVASGHHDRRAIAHTL